MLPHFTVAPPASAAPHSPPIRACDDDDGRPRHQVSRFQAVAPMRAPAQMATPVLPIGTSMMSAPIVSATRTPAKPPSRFITAASASAIRGVSARVDTDVATALAASWNPLV